MHLDRSNSSRSYLHPCQLYSKRSDRTDDMATPDVLSPMSAGSMQEQHSQSQHQAEGEERRLNSYVGFSSITRQIEHKLLKRGFQFNVMVVVRALHVLNTSTTLIWG